MNNLPGNAEAQANALIEAKLQSVVNRSTREQKSLTYGGSNSLALGAGSIQSLRREASKGYRFWSVVMMFGGVAGFARTGLRGDGRGRCRHQVVLNVYGSWMAKRRLAAKELSNEIDRTQCYKRRGVMLRQRLVATRRRLNRPADGLPEGRLGQQRLYSFVFNDEKCLGAIDATLPKARICGENSGRPWPTQC